MSKRYITVRILRPDGRPAPGVRVMLWVYQFMASGSLTETTRADGTASFEPDMDASAEVAVWVDGKEREKRAAPKAQYTFVL